MTVAPTVAPTVTLDDKYSVAAGRVYLTGTQALVRLPMLQRARDAAAGLNTAGFVSGYRGSPLGGLDKELWRAAPFLKTHHIHFQPGLNEDLAATAVWGSQQVGLFPGARHDGVFALWYGKGPGVDRSGDVFKHGNNAGTAPHGGVLVLAGDDHGAKSSTAAHQSEYAFMDAMIPVLNPASVRELLDYGLIGWAMSRFSGCWVAMKAIAETVDSSASVWADPARLALVTPDDVTPPPGGLHIRWPDRPLDQELRLMRHKLYAALAFARANRLDRVVMDSPNPRFGIVTTGKAYLDVRQALDDLGIDDAHAAEIGLRVYKVAMSWPLERDGVRAFAEGLEEILVVEEKRALIENQLKEQLYNWREDVRPRVIGKFDEEGAWILPSAGELTPAVIAKVIARRIDRFYTSNRVRLRLDWLEAKERSLARVTGAGFQRVPYFCAGCPHNTSTAVPEGSRAMAGIGCHYMVTWMDRATQTFSHMGGEGAAWIGQAPFTDTQHVFQNLGDGTYVHSGSLAIRAAIAAGVNITYKILYNDAVAMTGGQPVDGPLSVERITRALAAEGVARIAVVTDEPAKYGRDPGFAAGTTIHHRDQLDTVQKELRDVTGVSILVYDQTCAAEKRRRRKRGKLADPPKRVFINQRVCEGCGDCGVQSNCVAVVPVETALGRKRAIDQSACNKDFSCLKGFCPSFVTVHGAAPHRPAGLAGGPDDFPDLPEPVPPSTAEPYGIVVTGIGGTGVVTIGALLGMAAHLEGKGVTVLDMTGLAQKNGAVVSHLRIADRAEAIHSVRISAGGAHLLLGCDMVVAAGLDALSKARAGITRAVVNAHETMTADFTHAPDLVFPEAGLRTAIIEATGPEAAFIDATRLAAALLGDTVAANPFMVGFAWQQGLIPLSAGSILRAIELNGAAVEANRRAFLWGRRAAADRARVEDLAGPATGPAPPRTLDELVAHRAGLLTGYQNAAYGARYRARIETVRAAEARLGLTGLTAAVARGLYGLMAIKDEYEVARLYTDGAFARALAASFAPGGRIEYHLAPPLLARRDPATGHLVKSSFGPWMGQAFKLLARLKGLRGTVFDVFGRSAERRMERAVLAEYEVMVDELVAGLSAANHVVAVEAAELAERVRGFGHVKDRNLAETRARWADLMERFRRSEPSRDAAE